MVHYLIEAISVGLLSLMIGTFLSVSAMYYQSDFKISKINFWMSLLVTNFLIGFFIHLLCEWVGINKWYCKNGYACKKS
jgi:hypothetical protein